MLLYKLPSCKSIRILTILISGPASGLLLVGLLPQETDRRCDLTAVVGVVRTEGVASLGGGDESTSRQETDGDFTCWNRGNYDNTLRNSSTTKKKYHLYVGYFVCFSLKSHVCSHKFLKLRHSPKYLLLYSTEERKTFGFRATWRWVIDDILFIKDRNIIKGEYMKFNYIIYIYNISIFLLQKFQV